VVDAWLSLADHGGLNRDGGASGRSCFTATDRGEFWTAEYGVNSTSRSRLGNA
jgi:hypothetical protein